MSSIDTLFTSLRSQNRKALMPFITAGDPDLDFTAAVLKELVARGASMCELGIPYSDPIADGPVIQASYTRVLRKGLKLKSILDMTREVTAEVEAPIVSMVSYAIVLKQGLEKYVAQAKAAGLAGAIVPDLLVEEAGPLAEICRREDFSLIQLVTPTTPRERAVRIAESSTGFIYYVSVTGITGERKEIAPELIDSVSWLREQTELPICIGFGISQAEHVKRLREVADGLIVGSAIVRRMAEVDEGDRAKALAEIGEFVEGLVGAMKD